MNFDDFLNQAWDDHAAQANQVGDRLHEGIQLIENSARVSQLAHLITHVFGEHLGRWDDGAQILKKLPSRDGESEQAIARSIASLDLASGRRESVLDLSLSDQIRAMAVAAAALSEQKNPQKAHLLFQTAVEKAQTGIDKHDPANRALAVTGNNLACSLEEKTERNAKDTELMILAAKVGRKYWEIAGTWKEVTWGEYRLAMTYLKAPDLTSAIGHAQTCLELARENQPAALELFFAFEVLALVERARHNELGFNEALAQATLHFAELSPEDKVWCEPSLRKLNP